MPKRKLEESDGGGGSDDKDQPDAEDGQVSSSSSSSSAQLLLQPEDSTSRCSDESSSGASNCSLNATDSSCDATNTSGSQESFTQLRKKVKKSVNFEGVTVYYFPRKQGFTCVPSQGGSTLGMAHRHTTVEKFSLSEYARLQRSIHRQILVEHQQQGKIALPPTKPSDERTPRPDEENSESSDEETLNVDDYYFLQPLPARQRRILLRQAGIKKIDAIEKEECREIRSSREFCGCECRVYCDPDSCLCSKSGIRCQVDRMSFPCGCTRDGCRNTRGRIEFNPVRVRTHFIRTIMQLEMEKKLEARQLDGGVASAATPFFQMSVVPPPRKKACVAGGVIAEPIGNARLDEEDGGVFYEKNNAVELRCVDEQSGLALPNVLDRESYEKGIVADGHFDGAVDMATGMSDSMQFFSAAEEIPDGSAAGTTVGCMAQSHVMLYQPGFVPDVAPEYELVLSKKDDGSSTEGSDCTSEGSEDADSVTDFSSCDAALYDGRQTQLEGHCSVDSSCKQPHVTPGVFDHMTECKALAGVPMEGCYADGNRLVAEKYIGGAGSAQPYKLEPISEILNPIRFTNYTGLLELQAWGSAEYPSGVAANGGGMISLNGAYPSMVPGAPVLHPPHVPSNYDMGAFQVIGGPGDLMSAPSAGQACALIHCPETIPASDPCCEDFIAMNHVSPFAKRVSGYLESAAADTDDSKTGLCKPVSFSGLQEPQDERPKYHEMMSSTQPSSSGLESVLSSLHSDLTPVEFHPLGQSSELVRPCSDGSLMTFGLPESGYSPKPGRADAINPTPPETVESCCLSASACSLSMSSGLQATSDDAYDVLKMADGMTCSKADDTLMQNFGEIIKESIVGTASA